MSSIRRPLTEVLKDILDNLQDIIRSEARLAKAELRDDLEEYKEALAWIAVAGVTGLFAFAFLLVGGFFALRFVLPPWAAAAIIALALAVVCGLSLAIGRHASRALRSSSIHNPTKESELGRND